MQVGIGAERVPQANSDACSFSSLNDCGTECFLILTIVGLETCFFAVQNALRFCQLPFTVPVHLVIHFIQYYLISLDKREQLMSHFI